MRRVRKAVSLGLNVLEADFEKLDVDVANSDSEDDEANTKTPVMFERKVRLHCYGLAASSFSSFVACTARRHTKRRYQSS